MRQRGGVFERLRERTGRWYVHLLVGIVAFSVLAVAVPAYSALLIPYFEVTRDQYLRVVLSFEIAMLFATVVAGGALLHRHRPVRRWLAGDRGGDAAEAAWESVVCGVPRSALLLGAWYAACIVPPGVYIGNAIGLSAAATVGYCLVLLIAVAGLVAVAYLLYEQALRPIAQEAAEALPDDFEPRQRPVGLGTKVLILVPTITIYTAMLVATISSNSDSLEGRIALTMTTVFAVSGTVVLGLTLMFRGSLVRRLDDLRGAIGAVDEGDLTVHLPRLAGDELDEVGRTFNHMVAGLREREALHGALGSYVSADLVDRIARDGEVVEGEQSEVTVLFADIRDFTALVDRWGPAETVAHLNDFYALVLPIITRHGGHANKLLGDGLLAVFGVPVKLRSHARSALCAAEEMLDAVGHRYEDRLRIGVGLNTGPVIAGTVGGPGKLDYTVIGDAVNVAARVEALTKELGRPLLLTESTYARLGEGVELELCGPHRIRGKPRPVRLYAPAASSTGAPARAGAPT